MNNSTLNLILVSNQPILFDLLLKKDGVDYKELLYYLLQNNSIKVAKDKAIVKYIYARLKFNKTNKSKLLINASKFDFIELVKLLLSSFKRGDEMKDDSKTKKLLADSFFVASRNGSINVVRLLLTNIKVDPRDYNSNAIREASLNGWSEVVKLLLADPRVDPALMITTLLNWHHNAVMLK